MKKYEPDSVRNVGLFAHGGDGKTSIAEAILFVSGENNRLGSVNDGTSLMDFEPEEIERKITISSSLAFIEWRKHKINLLDTPGDDNFISDAKFCMRVCDLAILVLTGIDGVKVQTEKVWEFAKENSVPTVVFVNKLDRERSEFERALASLKESFGDSNFIPVQIPIGKEDAFKGVVDLLEGRAHIYGTEELGVFEERDVPEDMKDIFSEYREKLIETVVEMDDEVVEKYLNGEEIELKALENCLKKGLWEGKLVPVLCGSAIRVIGIRELLDFIVRFGPPPTYRKEVEAYDPKSGERIKRRISAEEPFSGFVFKTISDPYAGRLNLFKVFSGELLPDMTVLNVTKDEKEKIGQIFSLVGKKQKPIPCAVTGDIAVVAKLKNVGTGDTLCDERAPLKFEQVKVPPALISFSLRPKTKGDEDKLNASLSKLMEEDLTIRYARDEQTKEFILSGMGQVHIEVIVERLKRKFGVEVELKEPKVPYKETIKGIAKAQGKYKRQSGGRGQYGDTWLEVSPLPRGEGFVFEDKIVGGVIPKQYIPAVEKGVLEAMQQGILAGYPVTDVKVTLYDGSYHEVDSSEMAFKIAASMGFKKCMEMANPVLLEPIMKMEIIVPEENLGDVMGDLNSRRGKILGVEAKGNNQVIKAHVPMAEILRYAPDLRSMTGGRGTFTMEFSHYEEVPPHIAQKIIEQARKEREQEK